MLIKENKNIIKAVGILKSMDINTVFVKFHGDNIGMAGGAIMEKSTILVDSSTQADVSDILSTIFHEAAHIYCFKNDIYPIYHNLFVRTRICSRYKMHVRRTALRAERFVDKSACKLMKTHFPKIKFKYSYKSKIQKEWFRNYIDIILSGNAFAKKTLTYSKI